MHIKVINNNLYSFKEEEINSEFFNYLSNRKIPIKSLILEDSYPKCPEDLNKIFKTFTEYCEKNLEYFQEIVNVKHKNDLLFRNNYQGRYKYSGPALVINFDLLIKVLVDNEYMCDCVYDDLCTNYIVYPNHLSNSEK